MCAVDVAALFVDPQGTYADAPGIDVWGEERDARRYNGPWPVVAHPPCQRWSVLAGLVESRYGYARGDDGGCFASALLAVRTFGGVLEHPAKSAAWREYALPKPVRGGGWVSALGDPGWSCWVDQGWYGHPLKKPTWLYAVGVDLAALTWGSGPGMTFPHRHHTDSLSNLWRNQRDKLTIPTPPAFRDVLLTMARSAAAAHHYGP